VTAERLYLCRQFLCGSRSVRRLGRKLRLCTARGFGNQWCIVGEPREPALTGSSSSERGQVQDGSVVVDRVEVLL